MPTLGHFRSDNMTVFIFSRVDARQALTAVQIEKPIKTEEKNRATSVVRILRRFYVYTCFRLLRELVEATLLCKPRKCIIIIRRRQSSNHDHSSLHPFIRALPMLQE